MKNLLHISSPIADVIVNTTPFTGIETGRIITLSGPSGAGKTTIATALHGHERHMSASKLTTRLPRREATMDTYTDAQTISASRATGDFLYFMTFGGSQYLQPAAPITRWLAAGLIVLVDAPSLAALGLKQGFPDLVTTVFVDVPEPHLTLPIRLRKRGETDAEIVKRVDDDLKYVCPLRSQFDTVFLNTEISDEDVAAGLRQQALTFERH